MAATSALGLGQTPAHICAGTGCTPATSAPGTWHAPPASWHARGTAAVPRDEGARGARGGRRRRRPRRAVPAERAVPQDLGAPATSRPPGPGVPLPSNTPALGSPPAHICATTGPAARPTSLPGLGPPSPLLHQKWAHPAGTRAALRQRHSAGAAQVPYNNAFSCALDALQSQRNANAKFAAFLKVDALRCAACRAAPTASGGLPACLAAWIGCPRGR
jgi:hypothetical protein